MTSYEEATEEDNRNIDNEFAVNLMLCGILVLCRHVCNIHSCLLHKKESNSVKRRAKGVS